VTSPGTRLHNALEVRLPSISRCFFLFLIVTTRTASRAKGERRFQSRSRFSKFKTFAYIGGVERLAMMQLNPIEIRNNSRHRSS
jgi:hypothetical protein